MKLFSLNELFFYMATIINQQIIAIFLSSSSILLPYLGSRVLWLYLLYKDFRETT